MNPAFGDDWDGYSKKYMRKMMKGNVIKKKTDNRVCKQNYHCKNNQCIFYHPISPCKKYKETGNCDKIDCPEKHPKQCRNFLAGICRWKTKCVYLHHLKKTPEDTKIRKLEKTIEYLTEKLSQAEEKIDSFQQNIVNLETEWEIKLQEDEKVIAEINSTVKATTKQVSNIMLEMNKEERENKTSRFEARIDSLEEKMEDMLEMTKEEKENKTSRFEARIDNLEEKMEEKDNKIDEKTIQTDRDTDKLDRSFLLKISSLEEKLNADSDKIISLEYTTEHLDRLLDGVRHCIGKLEQFVDKMDPSFLHV